MKKAVCLKCQVCGSVTLIKDDKNGGETAKIVIKGQKGRERSIGAENGVIFPNLPRVCLNCTSRQVIAIPKSAIGMILAQARR